MLYLHANIKAADMLSWLGIKSSVTAVSLLSVMREWSQQESFTTSLQHMTAIYDRLSWEMASEPATARMVCAAFELHPMIWLPEKECSIAAAEATTGLGPHTEEDEWQRRHSSRSRPVVGRFYGTADKLFVRDHTHVIESTNATSMRVLLKYYSSDTLHSFFLQQLHYTPSGGDPTPARPATPWGAQHQLAATGFQPIVPLYPSTADYCDLLASFAAQQNDSSSAGFEQALQLLRHWSGLIGTARMPSEEV